MKNALLSLTICCAVLLAGANAASADCPPGYKRVEKTDVDICQSAFAVTAEFDRRSGKRVATSSFVQRLAEERPVRSARLSQDSRR